VVGATLVKTIVMGVAATGFTLFVAALTGSIVEHLIGATPLTKTVLSVVMIAGSILR